MSEPTQSSYEQERRAKLDKLRALGVDPYGTAIADLKPLLAVRQMYDSAMGHDGGPTVSATGRIVLLRSFGKLTFITLRDESGDLQIGLDKKRLSERDWAIGELLDLGDLCIVTGKLGQTRKLETTIWADSIAPAAKALLPPPAKWEGLADVELRYRQRYVDLWANPEVMKTLKLRMQIVQEIRSYFAERGYLEVETPMMQPIAGGAAARPFVTHHNALDIPLYLRIAPELYLKRLLVGGFTKVFELNRNFRNEGISPRHNPEFTMLEAYEAFGSWETMADLVEGMICHIAKKLFGGLKIEHKNAAGEVTKTIDLTRPWRRATMMELVEESTKWRFNKINLFDEPAEIQDRIISGLASRDRWIGWSEEMRQSHSQLSVPLVIGQAFQERLRNLSPAEQFQEVYEKLVEPKLMNPTFVTHVPSIIIPLAKKNAVDPFFADVYELAINGQEISPGYSELNDPDMQAANFAHQVGDEAEKQKTDEDFLTALKYGMPPAGGLGLGIDRLVMMLTGAESIRDVILFPLMKPLD